MTTLEQMLAELESYQLRVVLAPSKRRDRREHDMIRVVAESNAPWYKNFCARHHSDRIRKHSLHDTRIKRAGTILALRRLIAGEPAGKYGPELLKIAASLELRDGCLRNPVKSGNLLSRG